MIMDLMNSDQVTVALVTAVDKADHDIVVVMLMTKLAKTYLAEHEFELAAEMAAKAAVLRATVDTVPNLMGEKYTSLFEQRLEEASGASLGPTWG